MKEYKIPSDYELDGLAEDFVCSANDDECLREFLNDRGYAFVKEQMSDLINYILLSSDAAYQQMRDNAISEFRESLNTAISNASWILFDEDKLKVMIEVASGFCYT